MGEKAILTIHQSCTISFGFSITPDAMHLPPHTTGPISAGKPAKDQSIPNLVPTSLTGLMDAQLAATSVTHAPLAYPKVTRPITIGASVKFVGVHKLKRKTEARNPKPTKAFHTPNLSAIMPDVIRPKKLPVWMKTTA